MHDQWELYHVEKDRTEMHDLAGEHRDKLLELIAMWFAEAGRNNVLPLDDRTAVEILNVERPEPVKPRTSYTYYPDTTEVPEGVAPNIRNKSYSILAEVQIDTQEASGVIMAQGGSLRWSSPVLEGRETLLRLQLPGDRGAAVHF